MQRMLTLYVSPHGHDAWSGRLPDTNATTTDGPLRTLAAAQKAVRTLKAGLAEPADIRVVLRGGLHELDEPWRFHAEDGGFGRTTNRLAQTLPVVWAAYPGEKPVISGGRRLGGPWTRETVNGVAVYACTPPAELLVNGGFTQLWVNGQRRVRPRLPKRGLWQVERGLGSDFSVWGHAHPSKACVYKEGQLRAEWRNLTDIELHFFAWWVDRHVKIARVDEASRTVHFDRTAKLRMEWGPGDGVDFVVENVFEALTDPGEWYLDRTSGKLYYIPLPDEDMDTVEVVAGRLQQLLDIDGGGVQAGRTGNQDNRGEGGGHLRFEGLAFAHCEWRLPDDQAGDMQAAVNVPAAVSVRGAEDCVFADCEVAHVNTYAMELRDGTVETRLENCRLHDLGAGGVKIWHGCKRNAVVDCEIGPGGLVFAAACGVLIGRAAGNRVEHCHIHDFFYTGISAGWNWGYAESDGYGNVLEWNHIHDLGKGLLSDMGGIYLLGHACGTRLRYNHVHDITCRRYGGWCLYTDEGSTDVLIESNLAYNADKEVFHQHYGRNNTVRNNIFAFGGEAVLAYGKPELHIGLIFERNILLSRDAPILRGVGPDRWTPRQAVFDSNLYWCETGPVSFAGGGAAVYGSQPFPNGFKSEATRFAPLGDVPNLARPPTEADWRQAMTLTRFFVQSGATTAADGLGEVRFLRQGVYLHVRGTFGRPALREAVAGALWSREHIELFLKPFADRPAMVQLGLAADGQTEHIWHDCAAPDGFDWAAEACEVPGGWQATLRIPLKSVAAAAGGAGDPDWRFLVGFATPPELSDWSAWQGRGHDKEGVVDDPMLVDPNAGDFRLRPDSPAPRLGFQPWDFALTGPRLTQQEAESCHP